jgi:hypothetical protein
MSIPVVSFVIAKLFPHETVPWYYVHDDQDWFWVRDPRHASKIKPLKAKALLKRLRAQFPGVEFALTESATARDLFGFQFPRSRRFGTDIAQSHS